MVRPDDVDRVTKEAAGEEDCDEGTEGWEAATEEWSRLRRLWCVEEDGTLVAATSDASAGRDIAE